MISFEGLQFKNEKDLRSHLWCLPMGYVDGYIKMQGHSLFVVDKTASIEMLKSSLIDSIVKKYTQRTYILNQFVFHGTKERIKEQVFAKINHSDVTFKEGKPFVFGIEIADGGIINGLVASVKGRIGGEIDNL